jgi:hypothetical protein
LAEATVEVAFNAAIALGVMGIAGFVGLVLGMKWQQARAVEKQESFAKCIGRIEGEVAEIRKSLGNMMDRINDHLVKSAQAETRLEDLISRMEDLQDEVNARKLR